MELVVGKEKLLKMFKNSTNRWNVFRILRLVFGLIILIDGIITNLPIFIFAGAVFSGMAIFNFGCCTTQSCKTQPKDKKENFDNEEDVIYEEIK